MTTNNNPKFWLEPLYRIASLEYALIEACHSEAPSASDDEQARFAARAGTAQVHLFDLGTALRDLGEDSISYARCMRSALMFQGTHADLLERLEREYMRLLAKPELPCQLHDLLRSNLSSHRGFDVPSIRRDFSVAA
ncbi:MAG: hypothetical protein ABI321_20570 [Polyangia bacterium]